MKNREKHKNELLECIKVDGWLCGFVKKHGVFRMLGMDWGNYCGAIDCHCCNTILDLWLDEEYEEPPKPEVDWNKVPVDTLVRVRNRESEDWRLMYFKEFRTDYVFKRHITWKDGKTSKTAEGDCVGWQYCELVEEEDDEE